MPDPTNDIDELASFLSKVVECDSTRCDSDDARPWIAALTALIVERNALKQRVAELEAQSPATSDLRERDEAMTLWMDQVTAMLCHSMTHSHDAKQTLVTRCDTAIAAMRKGEQNAE